MRERNPEPTLDAVQHALHEVIAQCIYGVDLNPMAVELAKVALWLEAMEPGKPLSFLDAHLKHGNSLIGTTPELLRGGIPNSAFKAIEGDDPDYARFLASENDSQRKSQLALFDVHTKNKISNKGFAADLRRITEAPAGDLAQVHQKAADYQAWESSAEYLHSRHVADAWCAAFMWHKSPDAPTPVTQDVFLGIQEPNSVATSQETHGEIVRLRKEYGFFHWHLAFPDVFYTSGEKSRENPTNNWIGGFSCVLSNPPWDRLEFEDKKYFSLIEPSIAELAGINREKRIKEWLDETPDAAKRYHQARRKLKSTSLFASNSGMFPQCAKGLTVAGVTKLQADQLFTELFHSLTTTGGRVGCIVPTAIVTSAGSQHLSATLVQTGAIASLYDFENRKQMFSSVHSSYKFCLLTLTNQTRSDNSSRFGFFLQDPSDLDDSTRVIALDSSDIALINPNTKTLPIMRTRRDAELTISAHRRFPVLKDDSPTAANPWNIEFKYLFRSANDGDLFNSRENLLATGWEPYSNEFVRQDRRMLPLYEAKMVDFFNHRAADVIKSPTAINRQNQPRYLSKTELQDPGRLTNSLIWVDSKEWIATSRKGKEVEAAGLPQRLKEAHWDRDWLCGWCDVTSGTNERTSIPSFIPRTPVLHTFPLMFPHVNPIQVAALVATQSSLVFDFVSRQKIGGIHMALMTWKQLPVPTPVMLRPHLPFFNSRVLELVFTAYDMSGLARDLGDSGQPFQWNDSRRVQIRAELDAFCFHLYGLNRDDADYILESFQSDSGGGLKNNEIAKYGTYRTKDLILAEYDRMAEAGVSIDNPLIDGENYTSTLNPPPGHGPRHPPADPQAEEA